jgi:hypothetical protein
MKERYYNDVTNVEKARICSELNTKSMLWDVARRTLKEVKAQIILLPRGGRGGDGIFMLDRFLFHVS